MGDRFPQQQDVDYAKPTEHFLWALCQIPFGATEAMPMQPNVSRTISKHLHECGFRHADDIAKLADKDGNIHISQLPKQEKRLQMPFRGQQQNLNAMARWVPMDVEDPEPVILPNVEEMTVHEQELMIQELKRVGRIQDPEPKLASTANVTTFQEILKRSGGTYPGGLTAHSFKDIQPEV